MVRTCLFSTTAHDAKKLLRGGPTDDEIKAWLTEVVLTRTPGHLIGQEEFVQPERTMIAIDGWLLRTPLSPWNPLTSMCAVFYYQKLPKQKIFSCHRHELLAMIV